MTIAKKEEDGETRSPVMNGVPHGEMENNELDETSLESPLSSETACNSNDSNDDNNNNGHNDTNPNCPENPAESGLSSLTELNGHALHSAIGSDDLLAIASNPQATLEDNGSSSEPKNPEKEKVSEKLQQVSRYITQTSSAMRALEQEGDLSKIRQYNTLVKCLRQLKDTESKLASHLGKNNTSETVSSGTGSEPLGVVRPLRNEGGSPHMQERLARSETEAAELSGRLRDNMARRQQLITRYEATRERLTNLRRQRHTMVSEERQLLQSMGAPTSPYEDPIPGADSWTALQLVSAIKDFGGLRTKIMALESAYNAKLRTTDESDEAAREEVQRKIDQISQKKTQILAALTQMSDLLQAKRQAEQNDPQAPISNISEDIENSLSSAHPENEESLPSSSSRVPIENCIENADDESPIVDEIVDPSFVAKQRQLKSLKDQLESMKQLLKISQEARTSGSHHDNTEEVEGALSDGGSSDEETLEEARAALGLTKQPLINQTIVGLDGVAIRLSETERRDPQLAAKYNQLTEARKRLAKMEEIISKINEAGNLGRPIDEILSPEHLALLNAAREEEHIFSLSNNDDSQNSNESQNSEETRLHTSQTAVEPSGLAMQNNREVSREWSSGNNLSAAMHFELDKKSPEISSVNEGAVGKEKGAVKRQPTEFYSERSRDPRLEEMLALQKELKEKKDALESLMERMDKASSYAVGNISDGCQDDKLLLASSRHSPSLNLDRYSSTLTPNHPSTASQNLFKNVSNFPLNHLGAASSNLQACQHESTLPQTLNQCDFFPGRRQFASDGNLNDKFASGKYSPRPFPSHVDNTNPRTASSIEQNSFSNKNFSRFNATSNVGFSADSMALNNLSSLSSTAPPSGVRPKLNRLYHRNIPATSWEDVPPPVPSAASSKVQNSVSFALSQLNQLQDTISSLYGDLRAAEENFRPQEAPSSVDYGPNAFCERPPVPPPSSLIPDLSAAFPITPGRGESTVHPQIISALQQCLSQLNVQSTQIQSIMKQMQVRSSNSFNPFYPFCHPIFPFFPPSQPPM